MINEQKALASSAEPVQSLLNRDFVVLWLNQLAFFGGFQLLMTAMMVYARTLGATPAQLGLVIGFFSITAMSGRLVVGWLADRGKKVPILWFGALVFILVSAGYALLEPASAALLISPVTLLLILRLVHGLGMATTTGAQTLIMDLSPTSRRGEALGLYGLTPTITSGIGPALGMAIAVTSGYPTLFWISLGVAVVSLLLSLFVREPTLHSTTYAAARLFNPAVLIPGFTLLALMFTFGAVITFLPIYALERGLENPGMFFLFYSAAMFASQTLSGRASDRRGRLALIVPGMALAAAAMVAISASQGNAFLISAAVFGLGMGSAQQVLFAWAGDLVPAEQRGSAVATMGLFLDGGITIASITTGVMVEWIGLGSMFLWISLVPLAGLALAILRRPRI